MNVKKYRCLTAGSLGSPKVPTSTRAFVKLEPIIRASQRVFSNLCCIDQTPLSSLRVDN